MNFRVSLYYRVIEENLLEPLVSLQKIVRNNWSWIFISEVLHKTILSVDYTSSNGFRGDVSIVSDVGSFTNLESIQ